MHLSLGSSSTHHTHTSCAVWMKSNRPAQELILAGSQLLNTQIIIHLKSRVFILTCNINKMSANATKTQKYDFHNFKNLKHLKVIKCMFENISFHKPHIFKSYKKHILCQNCNGIWTPFHQNSTLHTFFDVKHHQTLSQEAALSEKSLVGGYHIPKSNWLNPLIRTEVLSQQLWS